MARKDKDKRRSSKSSKNGSGSGNGKSTSLKPIENDYLSDNDSVLNDNCSIISTTYSNYSTSKGGNNRSNNGNGNNESVSGRNSPDYGVDDNQDGNESTSLATTANQQDLLDSNRLNSFEDFNFKFSIILDELDSLQSKKSSSSSSKQCLQSIKSLVKLLQLNYFNSTDCEDLKFTNELQLKYLFENNFKLRSNFTIDQQEFFQEISKLFNLILISMNDFIDIENLFEQFQSFFKKQLNNPSASPIIRSNCATILSIGCYITDSGRELLNAIQLNLLNQILDPINNNGNDDDDDNDSSYQLSELNSMKINFLENFQFLLIITDSIEIWELLFEKRIDLLQLLDSNCLELRIATGELFALVFELLMENEFDFAEDQDSDEDDGEEIFEEFFEFFKQEELLLGKLRLLANDSQKSKSKKELREQRTKFRQILRTIESNLNRNQYEQYQHHEFIEKKSYYGPDLIKFNGSEKLQIDSWKLKCYYDRFCSIFGSGMNQHLSKNEFLRDLFDLGPPIVKNNFVKSMKDVKNDVKQLNNVNRKIREMNRSKQRGQKWMNY